jgi:hypothetical protein
MAAVGAALLGTGRVAELVLSRLISRPQAPLEVGAALVPDLARMASTVDELNSLAAELKANGVACSVLTRFTSDPWSDIIAQAGAVEADVVLIDRAFVDRQPAGSIPADPAFTLAIARLGAKGVADGDQVGVILVPGPDGRTALVLGSAAAGRLGGTLLVAAQDGGRAGRKVASALTPLRSAGLDVRMVDGSGQAAGASLVLIGGLTSSLPETPGAAAPSGTVVMVRAGLDDREAELVEQLAKLAAEPGS